MSEGMSGWEERIEAHSDPFRKKSMCASLCAHVSFFFNHKSKFPQSLSLQRFENPAVLASHPLSSRPLQSPRCGTTCSDSTTGMWPQPSLLPRWRDKGVAWTHYSEGGRRLVGDTHFHTIWWDLRQKNESDIAWPCLSKTPHPQLRWELPSS